MYSALNTELLWTPMYSALNTELLWTNGELQRFQIGPM